MATDAAAPHALLLPYPAQGHVIPFMELAHRLLDRGFAVTFVNTEFNHRRVVEAAPAAEGGRRLRLVGVPDGMDDGEDRDNLVRLNGTMQEAMPPWLEALLDGGEESAGGEGGLGRVTCVVVDVTMSWALDAAKRRGLPTAALWAASAAVLAVIVGAKNLICDGVNDDDGASVKLESSSSFRLAESMAPMDATFLVWNYMGNRDAERMVFHYLTTTAWAAVAKADLLLCNTFSDLEPDIFTHHSPPPSSPSARSAHGSAAAQQAARRRSSGTSGAPTTRPACPSSSCTSRSVA
ncbi:UDP-glycosyltransferase 83A1-like [Panicum miliaceum]|uniref:UDP-glycosyltransferase 83A1-like n=1 Tax=Panicum miliaceum TaxID=4540 RepID=A0A3L6TPI1_PANMI|nr:UDP-glycosyltransferase 83A1-like [Panicum miliaceum]